MNIRIALLTLMIGFCVGLEVSGCDKIATSPATSSPNPRLSAAPQSSPIKTSTPSGTVASASQLAALRPPLTLEKLKNAEYYFLAKGPVKLVNGKYEDPTTKRTFTLNDVVAYGDLNKDGIKDAVASIKVVIPNTGDFTYLVLVNNEAGTPKNISAEFLGPRIKVKTIAIKPDTTIEIAMEQYQPGDLDCCPSLALTRTYKSKGTNVQPAAQVPKND